MLLRQRLAIGVAALATAAWPMLPGCSSSNPRDINYGTDVGVGFVPPDSSVGDDADVSIEETGTSVDAGNDDIVPGDIDAEILDQSTADLDLDTSDIDTSIDGT